MAKMFLEIRVSVRWWCRLYIFALVVLCKLFDAEPNWTRVNWWLERGMRIDVFNGKFWRRIA